MKDLEQRAEINIEKRVSITETFRINTIIILVSLALVLRAVLNYTPPIIPLKVGDTAPEFSLKLKNGSDLRFSPLSTFVSQDGSKQEKGEPTVLFFYANWCPCSNASAPFLKQASEEFTNEGVNFIGIGFQDSESDLNKFIEKYNLRFLAGVDKQQEIARSYGVSTPPTTIFINKEGKIDSIFVGKIKKYEDISERIKKII